MSREWLTFITAIVTGALIVTAMVFFGLEVLL